MGKHLANIDELIFLRINELVGKIPILDYITTWIVSDYLVPAVVCLTLLGLWFSGINTPSRMLNQKGILAAMVSLLLANGIVFASNIVYFRDRPFTELDVNLLFYQPTDSSFPANSATSLFSLTFAICRINKRLGTILIPLATVFGLSRVYSGVHYPLDIVAGAIIGFAATWVAFKILKKIEPLPTMVIKIARILCLA